MIVTAIVMLVAMIFAGLLVVSIGAAMFTFLPALAIFIGQLWMTLFSAALHLLGVGLILLFVICCASVIHLV